MCGLPPCWRLVCRVPSFAAGRLFTSLRSVCLQITEEVKGVLSTVGNGAADLLAAAKGNLWGSLGGAAGSTAANPTFNYS